MIRNIRHAGRNRRGAIVVLAAAMMAVLVGLISFAVDHGFLLKTRTDLQRAADAAALAAVRDLVPYSDGTQDVGKARETVRAYVRDNLNDESFQVASQDIEIGRYDPQTIYSNVVLLNNGQFDTVRVTLRRDGATNPSVPLFFARVLGTSQAAVTASATAVLQRGQIIEPGAEVLPFATPKPLWDSLEDGEIWSAYGDGKLKDENGNDVPGNWGTLNIGDTSNSTSETNDQVLNGLRQHDLEALYANGRIPQSTHIDSDVPAWMNGNPGLSSGMKQSVTQVHGQMKLIPIFDTLDPAPGGNNLEFRVVGWGAVQVIDSEWHGNVNTRVIVKKSHAFHGKLRPNKSLSSGSGYVEGAYTSPVLIQ